MTGRQLDGPRIGDSSELLAEMVLGRLSFATRVLRQHDVGHDFYCVLAERRGRFRVAGDIFTVQVKTQPHGVSRPPTIDYRDQDQKDWLANQAHPFFVCVASPRELRVEFYSTWNLLNAVHMGLGVPVSLAPGETIIPIENTDVHCVPLGPPVLAVSATDVFDDAHRDKVVDVLKDWVALDRRNLINRSAGMYFVDRPSVQSPNDPPGVSSERQFYVNKGNLALCRQNLARSASAVRVLLPPAEAEQSRVLDELLAHYPEALDSRAIEALRNKVHGPERSPSEAGPPAEGRRRPC